MDTLGVGIIGFGFIGKVHAYGYRSIPLFYDPAPVQTRLVGVAECDEARARAAQTQGGFEFATLSALGSGLEFPTSCSPTSSKLFPRCTLTKSSV